MVRATVVDHSITYRVISNTAAVFTEATVASTLGAFGKTVANRLPTKARIAKRP